ncbi:MAG: acetyl-coenzyme A synthetase N-terminal domain-containing protein, partial [Saprospiraceae bacterium]
MFLMPYQIRTLEEYHTTYARSVADPEGFWADIASYFTWRK